MPDSTRMATYVGRPNTEHVHLPERVLGRATVAMRELRDHGGSDALQAEAAVREAFRELGVQEEVITSYVDDKGWVQSFPTRKYVVPIYPLSGPGAGKAMRP